MLAFQCPEITVTVVDKNPARIESWNSDDLPMYEPGLSELIAQVRQRKDACNLTFSCDVGKAIGDADFIMLCIDTPTKSHGTGRGMALDLAHVQEAVRTIAEVATTDKVIVEKSTVPGGTASMIQDLVSSSALRPIGVLLIVNDSLSQRPGIDQFSKSSLTPNSFQRVAQWPILHVLHG